MNRRTFISAICFLQMLTAILLCISPAPMGVTAVWALASVVGEYRFVLAAVYFTGAALALHREWKPTALCRRSVGWYLPQLFVLTVGACGALVCISNGHYADGVPRPVPFIMRDQAIYPILVFLYLRAIAHE